MKGQINLGNKRPFLSWSGGTVLAAAAVVLLTFAAFVHPFLAINEPVSADVLVVEGWVPDYVLDAAVVEFARGHYTRLLVSGLEFEKGDADFAEGSDAARSARRLAGKGVDRSLIEACPAPATGWDRTSSMARAVRDRLPALNMKPKGVNLVTLGPHARQTRLAYRRMLDPGILVGVISIPKDDYVPARWWASGAGIKKTTKDFAGWAKELLLGPRT